MTEISTQAPPTKHEVNLPCAICRADRSTVLHELRYPEYGYPGVFAVRRCDGCGLLYNSPRLADAQIGRLYDSNYYVFQEPRAVSCERVGRLFLQTIAPLETHVRARRALEIGCARGYMMALMKWRGWDVSGVEVSEYAAAEAMRAFAVPVFTGTLEELVGTARFVPVPVVVTTDVIEHVLDLRAFVVALNRALDRGGVALIGTPNADSVQRTALGGEWEGFNPFHIYLFGRDNLTRLLREHGFEVERAYTYNNGDSAPVPARSPLHRRAREALSALRILPAARAGRRVVQQAVDVVAHPLRRELARTIASIERATPYFDTDDGRSERCHACTGDNLVIVARKLREATPES